MGIHLFSPLYTPQQVGTAERRHLHVMGTTLTLLHQAFMPHRYWSYSCQTVMYLINRMTTPILHGKSPIEARFHLNPNYSCTFGCFVLLG